MKPEIKMPLPGPMAKKVIEDNKKFRYPSIPANYPLVPEEGEGVFVRDIDGNTFLDFGAGIAVLVTGHCHPRVVDAIQKQAAKLGHMPTGQQNASQIQVDLVKKLTEVAPGNSPKKMLFANCGAETVEHAIKLARSKTRRRGIIAFTGAFHGRTLGAGALTCTKVVYRAFFGPLLPEVYHASYAYCYRCPYKLHYGNCEFECVEYIKNIIFKRLIAPDEIAAIIVEPIQGEGGYIIPPPEFLKLLKEITEEHRIAFVVDEIQSGMGRTGKMWSIEHFGIEPDIMCTAKGLASGLPMGATIAKKEFFEDVKPGAHSGTFSGNPVCCAAALETIKLLEEGLIENAATVGKYALDRLLKVKDTYEIIGDVRGKGLMIGIEIVKNKKSKEENFPARNSVIQKAFQKGLLLLPAGPSDVSVIRLSPSLILSKDEADIGLDLLEQAIKEVIKE